ncbi:hypothetical protein WME98_21175 [Sorangium sp. So ce296]|uniref:hypothetical protein n=1 Tax=Sorangium sp. So ce296 TaxID=3133296 RepID=UPI003F628148
MHPRRILQRWLIEIAVQQGAKYHEKSYRRHEVAVGGPTGLHYRPCTEAYRRHEVAMPDPRAYVAGRVPSPMGRWRRAPSWSCSGWWNPRSAVYCS